MKRLFGFAVLVAVAPLWAAEPAVTAPAPAAPSGPIPVAKVGATVFTQEQMDKDLGTQLFDAQNRLYQLKRQWIDQQAKNVLFEEAAKKAGISRPDWYEREINKKVTMPSDSEIAQMIERYGGVKGDAAQFRQQVIGQMMAMKRQQQEQTVFERLAKATPVTYLLEKPVAPHVAIAPKADDPVRGRKNASVTVIEYSDFQCPYCKQSQATVQRIESTYGDKIQFIARQYPLPFHDRAKPAAEAALCAKDQGKFWQYRDKLFPSASLQDEDFKRFSKEVGLNEKKFNECLASHRHAAEIDATMQEAQKYGVSGTPTFFINGRPMVGNLPFSEFEDAIKDELAATKK